MKILVTGCDGFIGSNLVKTLPRTSDVYLHCGLSASVLPLRDAGFCNITHGDLSSTKVADILPDADVNTVVHLAGLPGGTEKELREANVAVTEGVVCWAARHNVKRIIFASTAAIYGDTCEIPAAEDAELHPQTPYAKSKLDSEILLNQLAYNGIDLIILRIPHVYGPGKHIGVLAAILSSIKKDGIVNLNGDGNEKRDFIFIDDVVNAFLMAAKLKNPTDVTAFNIGSGKALSLRNTCAIIGNVLGIEPEVRLTGKPAGKPHCIQLDVSKAKKHLGWSAEITLEEGVRRMV